MAWDRKASSMGFARSIHLVGLRISGIRLMGLRFSNNQPKCSGGRIKSYQIGNG
jgi:hypothetical protein